MSKIKSLILVKVGNRSYPVVVFYEPNDFVVEVNYRIIEALKKCEPASFGNIAINSSWITLKDNEGSIINPIEIMKVTNLSLKLIFLVFILNFLGENLLHWFMEKDRNGNIKLMLDLMIF